ncbi:tetratricopeptide repeat protein [Nocardia salmonicida]|uniref:tetratricopeptide repeat protein n=1 Tax=Nocardia salmonicida TaxID=53431 RepID=UPI00371394F2
MTEPTGARAEFLAELDALRVAARAVTAQRPPTVNVIARSIGVPASTVRSWFPTKATTPRTVPRNDAQLIAVLEFFLRRSGRLAERQRLDQRTREDWLARRAAAAAESSSPRQTGDQTLDDGGNAAASQVGAAGLPTERTGAGLMVVGRIPRRAPHFVDRHQVQQLRDTLLRSSVAVVVCGMRGAGKTQVAAAYAHEVIAARGPGLVAWVNAENRATLLAGLGEVAARVGVADIDGDSEKSAHRLRDHLSERQEPALLVLDNAANPDRIDTFFPVGGVTRVVVTSTDRAFTQFGALVDAGQGFARAESVHYLGEATGLDDPAGAVLVANDLGHLPLALSAAAATITGRRLDYGRYRKLLADQRLAAVLSRRRGSDHPLAVDQALLLAIQTVETPTTDSELDTVVRCLLGVMAMLAPDGVDHAMLPDHDGWLDAALQRCVEGSLLSWSEGGDVVVMHRLVGRVLRERASNTAALGQLAFDATAVMTPLLFDELEAFQRREEGSRVVNHVEALWDATRHADLGEDTTTVLGARIWATRQLIKAADTTRAISQADHTLTDCERILGVDHPFTLLSRNNLAYAYESAGRLTEAIALYERNLLDRVRIQGPVHSDTLSSRTNLAGAYELSGRLTEAIALHEETVLAFIQFVGREHAATLAACNNLATAYLSAERFTNAILLYEKTLNDSSRILGSKDSDTLSCRSNLALAYLSVGRLPEAIAQYEQTLLAHLHILGPKHPNTMVCRGNLAAAYEVSGRLPEAIALYEQNHTDRAEILGPDHPSTLLSDHNLANAYSRQRTHITE